MPVATHRFDFTENSYAIDIQGTDIHIQPKKKVGRDAVIFQRMGHSLSKVAVAIAKAKKADFSYEDIQELKIFTKEFLHLLKENKNPKQLVSAAKKAEKIFAQVKVSPPKPTSKREQELTKLLNTLRENAFQNNGEPLKNLGDHLITKAAPQCKTYQSAEKVFFSKIAGMLLSEDSARKTLIKQLLPKAIIIDKELKHLHALLKQTLSDDAVDLLHTTLEQEVQAKKLPLSEPFSTIDRILKRNAQIASAHFENTQMTKLEILNLAFFIEVKIFKVENLAKRYFSKEETGLVRSLQVHLRKKEVYILADFNKSLLQAEGTFKRAATAAKFCFQKLEEIPEIVAQLVTKTEDTKTAQAREKEIADTKREVRLSKKLKHAPRGIVKIRATCSFNETSKKHSIPKMSILADKGDGDIHTNIFKAEKKITSDEEYTIAEDLIHGLSYMHEHNLVHGDLKPRNCLFWIDSKSKIVSAKITDFGFAFEYDPDDLENAPITSMYKVGLYGTPHYTAPELLGTKNFRGNFSKTDVWALGCTLFALHFRTDGKWCYMLEKHDTDNFDNDKVDFKDEKELQKAKTKFKSIVKKEVEAKLKKLPSKKKATKKENFERLIYEMLQFEPEKRPSMQDAINEMQAIRNQKMAPKRVRKVKKHERS